MRAVSFDILRSIKNAVLVLALIGSAVANPLPDSANIPGYIPVTVKPGTNTVSNLPFNANMRPRIEEFRNAKPGDTVTWKNETHVFDGKTWSGKEGAKALVPIHESFTIIRTANATDVWDIGGEIDLSKAEKQFGQKHQSTPTRVSH